MIIVAIVGAIAVGLIVSRVSSDTSGQANVQGAATGSQGQLFIGGSTTVYPITLALQNGFQNQYHLQLVISQGGSDAGMQGVISGALNIGAASSTGAVNNAQTDVVNNDIQGVTINPTLIGGSAIVVIENGAGTGGFLTDGAGNVCQGVTKAALAAIFEIPGSTAAWGLSATACANTTPTWSTIDTALTTSTTICSAAGTTISVGPDAGLVIPACGTFTGGTGPVYAAVSRSDNSGTQDQFASYTGLPKQSAGGNYPGNTESGNPGILNYVNTHPGTIGFVDLGFAEGAATGAVCGAGWSTGLSCGVALPQVISASPGQNPIAASTVNTSTGTTFTLASGTTTAYDGYVAKLGVTANVHSAILTALKKAAFVDPLTLAGQVPIFPDTSSPSTGLARTFYYVTNGTPTIPEEQFLSYATNYNQEAAYSANGYFSQYDMTSA